MLERNILMRDDEKKEINYSLAKITESFITHCQFIRKERFSLRIILSADTTFESSLEKEIKLI